MGARPAEADYQVHFPGKRVARGCQIGGELVELAASLSRRSKPESARHPLWGWVAGRGGESRFRRAEQSGLVEADGQVTSQPVSTVHPADFTVGVDGYFAEGR